MRTGAEKVGEIVVDFSFLRQQGLIRPIEPVVNEHGRKVGTRHYRVNYTMVIEVIDRDLQCKFLKIRAQIFFYDELAELKAWELICSRYCHL